MSLIRKWFEPDSILATDNLQVFELRETLTGPPVQGLDVRERSLPPAQERVFSLDFTYSKNLADNSFGIKQPDTAKFLAPVTPPKARSAAFIGPSTTP